MQRPLRATSRGTPRWVVRAEPLGTGRHRFHAPPLAITADIVILAAGTLGSSRSLLGPASTV